MTTTITAAFEGCCAVRIAGQLHDFSSDHAKGGVLPRTARNLLAEGADPEAVLRVTRDGTPAFADATLGQWAAVSVEERDRRGVRLVPYRDHSSARRTIPDGEAAVELREAA